MKSRNRDDFQDVPGYVAAMANSYERGELNAQHAHKRAQLVFAISGVMEVTTVGHHWLIPPQRALWIPGGVAHEMRARTDVELRTIFVRESDASIPLPTEPTLVNVSPLLRELIVRAVDLPIESGVSGAAANIVELIFSELHFVPNSEFYMPRVTDSRLLRIEAQLRSDPGNGRGMDEWAEVASMSPRTFSRRLKAQTGLSFATWRQQIRLTEAVVRLVEGESITSIALSLGYENSGSFSRMFKKAMGLTPRELATSRA
ncbi:helix-turn-helix transcriptional regulator [Caballeronia sp. LjRoot34]|uniref:AraC family transcriptional regulator n=1 Tax=Caballeronia sp. LjRoot34 TaxID=3342325 RepID=UPI003ED0EB3E